MKRRTPFLVTSLLAIALIAPVAAAAERTSSHDSDAENIIKATMMTPVTEPFTGSTNAIRGVAGGGVPWEIDEAKVVLSDDGTLKVKVEGLVLARRAPVPEELQGTNPVPMFVGIVSCLTSDAGTARTVNLTTDPVSASADGDARIRDRVELPTPCIAPIVFVASPTGAWFAATGA